MEICVFLFTFLGANQLLIIFNYFNITTLFLPPRIMSGFSQSAVLCIERRGFMHYSPHINARAFLFEIFKDLRKKHVTSLVTAFSP